MSRKTSWMNIFIQILLWLLFFSTPIVTQILNEIPWIDIIYGMKYYYPSLLIFPLVFYANYLWLVPNVLFKKKNWHFFILNIVYTYVLTFLSRLYLAALDVDVMYFDEGTRWIFTAVTAIFTILLIMTAIGIKSQKQQIELELKDTENQRVLAEQELLRLRNQLNPHFLFNTLNNISALINVNQDEAQESINRLSEMLRYVLYDSVDKEVSLNKEIDFMNNYIDLMRLRYIDTLTMRLDFPQNSINTNIAPLLFISLLENAFKYGASNQHACYINISLKDDYDSLQFMIKNSLSKRAAINGKGGVGLDNLKKRLSLLYPNKYTLTALTNDNADEEEYYEALLRIEKQ